MSKPLNADFEWTRAYPKAGDRPAAAYGYSDGQIRQIARGKQRYRPFASEDLYLKFADLDGSPEACLGFANSWGLLEKPVNISNPPSEALEFWRREIRRIKSLINALPGVVKLANSRGTFAVVGELNVLLVPGNGKSASPSLVMEPKTLLQAMNLQLALWVAGGGSLFTCEQCHKPFQAGVRVQRRSISKFCSVGCKNRHHYERRIER
jgi:hypothetical protein